MKGQHGFPPRCAFARTPEVVCELFDNHRLRPASDCAVRSFRSCQPDGWRGDDGKRIDFVGGARGLNELEQRVSSGEMAVAFALYPTQMPDLMAVADAGGIMPPKSTWFEPKLADGMVNHVLD